MSDAIAPAMHTDAEHEKHSEHSSADVEELAAKGHHAPAFYAQADAVPKTAGVLRMEAVARAKNTKSGRQQLYIIAACVVLMYFVYSMQSSTTYLYTVYATSSFASHSSGIATLGVATAIISAVSKPFIAKLSDVFARSYMYMGVAIFYACGFVMILKSPNLATYVVGSTFTAIASSGLDLMSTVLAADLVPLHLRGLAFGIISSPFIITPWFTAEIAEHFLSTGDWRWGYGMYAILLPAIIAPISLVLIYLEHRAKKEGVLNISSSSAARRRAKEHAEANGVQLGTDNGEEIVHLPAYETGEKAPLSTRFWKVFHELDTIGLLFLGFGWALLLLPFSLSSGADGGYSNPSLIAMLVVGCVLLIVYVAYERYFARFPTAPLRLLKNRTFLMAIVIDFIYMVAGYMYSSYLTSYVLIVTDYSTSEMTYYSNTLTMGLCGGGVVAGLIMKFTRRYKLLQVGGLALKIVGMGLLVDKSGVHDTARLVISQVFIGIGGSFSVVASQVASQASVPHQDVALAISLLSLWTQIGVSIGSAIASGVWQNRMPGNLRMFLPASVDDATVALYFQDITQIKALPLESAARQGAIIAYERTCYPLFAGALALSFIPLVAACFQQNYLLGNAQNMYDGMDAQGEPTGEHLPENQAPKSKLQKLLSFWDQ